ncbi:MAG: hypothetical protein AAB288_08580 [Acidobacteriota bacterium]
MFRTQHLPNGKWIPAILCDVCHIRISKESAALAKMWADGEVKVVHNDGGEFNCDTASGEGPGYEGSVPLKTWMESLTANL